MLKHLLSSPQSWNLTEPQASEFRKTPLLANCKRHVVDCTDPRQIYDKIWPNPYRPFPDSPIPGASSNNAVSCGGALSNRTLVVFFDTAVNKPCNLWRKEESGGCYWNATAQARAFARRRRLARAFGACESRRTD